MLRGIPYYRVSTQRQGESGLGLEAQRKAVRLFAKQNNYKILQAFTEVESGKKSNRPILQKALEECRKQGATLLIAKLDRLGRNVLFISALMESEVKFVAVDNPHANELMVHILAAFAQFEHKAISKRTIDALKVAKERGVLLGSFSKVLAKRRKKESTDFAKKMKPVIRKLQVQGFETVRELTEILNEKNIKPMTGGDAKWHVSTVHKLLKQIENLK